MGCTMKKKFGFLALLLILHLSGTSSAKAETESLFSTFIQKFSDSLLEKSTIPECNNKLSLENIQTVAPGVIEIFDPFEIPLNYISVLANFSTKTIYSEEHKKCVAKAFTDFGEQAIIYSTFIKNGVGGGEQIFIEVEPIEDSSYNLIKGGLEDALKYSGKEESKHRINTELKPKEKDAIQQAQQEFRNIYQDTGMAGINKWIDNCYEEANASQNNNTFIKCISFDMNAYYVVVGMEKYMNFPRSEAYSDQRSIERIINNLPYTFLSNEQRQIYLENISFYMHHLASEFLQSNNH